ncbi:MAG TPA: response regulator [Cytophagales bacterium]|nr:response regulator [Cytophagales bacterium]
MSTTSILLVEDDDLDIISVERSLKKIEVDHQLYTAYNGIEALAMLNGENQEEVHPDIILLDINMPRMDGIEFLSRLRKEEKYKDIKVYVMTTSNEEQDRVKTEKLGISGYIIKPLNFNDNTKKTESMDNFMHFQILKIMSQ